MVQDAVSDVKDVKVAIGHGRGNVAGSSGLANFGMHYGRPVAGLPGRSFEDQRMEWDLGFCPWVTIAQTLSD